MFNNFFNEYKKICKIRLKDLPKHRRIIFVIILGLLSLCFLTTFILNFIFINSIFIFIPMAVAIIITMITGVCFEIINEKNRVNISKSYKKEIIKNLIDLLTEDRYNLYSEIGVNSLINYCDERINKNTIVKMFSNIGKYSGVIILPIILLYFKTIFDNFGENIIEALSFLIGLIILFYLVFLLIEIIKSSFEFGEKFKALREDLQYIKTQLNQDTKIEGFNEFETSPKRNVHS